MIKKIPGKGIQIDLVGGYRPMRVSPTNPAKYWDEEYRIPLLRCVASNMFPEVKLSSDGKSVLFTAPDRAGQKDLLCKSRPVSKARVPSSELRKLQKVLEKIHSAGGDRTSAIPRDRQEFLRNFRLPDPSELPDCWRISGHLWWKRLHVLWGLDKGDKSTFLPRTDKARANGWDESGVRSSIANRASVAGVVGFPGLSWVPPIMVPDGGSRGRGCLSALLKFLFAILGLLVIAGILMWAFKGCQRTEIGTGEDGRLTAITNAPNVGVRTDAPNVEMRTDAPNVGVRADVDPPRGNPPRATNGEDATTNVAIKVKPPEEAWGVVERPRENNEIITDSPRETPPRTTNGNDSTNGDYSSANVALKVKPHEEVAEDVDSPRDNTEIITDPPAGITYEFKVSDPIVLGETASDSLNVEFSIVPKVDLRGKRFEVSDWTVNDTVEQKGVASRFRPSGGLRRDVPATISATVTVDGKKQNVHPYQWNMTEEPTWQILNTGSSDSDATVDRYELVCCNSSSLRHKVMEWQVCFWSNGEEKQFKTVKQPDGDNGIGVKYDIGFFKGTYVLTITADIEYEYIDGRRKKTKHVEKFPFTHDSSAKGLSKAKYEVIIPNVYFCLAKTDRHGLINGTAFAISDKRLLTNFHVAVGGTPETDVLRKEYKVMGRVTLVNVRGEKHFAMVEDSDRALDVAVLKLCSEAGGETSDKLSGYLHFSTDEVLRSITAATPRDVFAVGYPKGTVCMGPPAFTDGKAEKIKSMNIPVPGAPKFVDVIFHYTNTEHGYSGGPLVDFLTGTVAGVNFGGFVPVDDKNKSAKLATSISEVKSRFPYLVGGYK